MSGTAELSMPGACLSEELKVSGITLGTAPTQEQSLIRGPIKAIYN